MVENKSGSSVKASYQSGLLDKFRYILNMGNSISKQENIGLATQFFEIAFLFLTRQLGPLLYYEARLWRRELTIKQKMRFLNGAQYKKRIAELNPPNYQKISQHKLVEKSVLTLLGVPTPEFIGFLHPQDGATKIFQPLTTAEQLASVLAEQGPGKICFKLTEGWGGRNFVAAQVSIIDGTVYLENLEHQGPAMEANDFFERHLFAIYHQGLVIEEYINQHSTLSELNATSVNTLRIWLIQHQDDVKLIGAILRMGRQSQVVDNASRGGIIAIVDCETGRLRQAMTPDVVPVYYSHHPDSNALVEGLELPYWQECIHLAKQSLRVFPRASFVGLDLAISETGPVIVELNLEPDLVSARNFGAPLSDLLS